MPYSDQTAQVVRMSVDKRLRRHGIGRQVLRALIASAKQQGYKRIVLETTSSWEGVVAFYLSAGFSITHQHDGDTYFALELEG
jgi:ribosomal protein S18 acetylase RimI-like enzyme